MPERISRAVCCESSRRNHDFFASCVIRGTLPALNRIHSMPTRPLWFIYYTHIISEKLKLMVNRDCTHMVLFVLAAATRIPVNVDPCWYLCQKTSILLNYQVRAG